MYVLEFYRRHEGLIMYKLFESLPLAQTAMIAIAHKLNSRDPCPFYEGKGRVEHENENTVRIIVNDVADRWGQMFRWYSEVRIVEVPVAQDSEPNTEQWPAYRGF